MTYKTLQIFNIKQLCSFIVSTFKCFGTKVCMYACGLNYKTTFKLPLFR